MSRLCSEGARLWREWMAACAIVQVRVADGMTAIDELGWQRIEENRESRAYQRGYLNYREHRMSCEECKRLATQVISQPVAEGMRHQATRMGL